MAIKKPNKIMFANWNIRDLALQVNLGTTAKERKQKQKVLLSLHFDIDALPKACETDNLADTICYDNLIKKIRMGIAGKHYHLIEHLTAEIYRITKKMLPKDARVYLSLVKYPKIKGLSGGVSFNYGG